MGAAARMRERAGMVLVRFGLRLMRSGRGDLEEKVSSAAEPKGGVKLSPHVSLSPVAAEMVDRGMQTLPATAPEPEEAPLRGSLESRFPTTR